MDLTEQDNCGTHMLGDTGLLRIPPYRDRPFRLNVTVCSG